MDDSFQDRWPAYDRAISGPRVFDPAMGLTLIQKPEAIIPHLIAKGVAPPKDIPEGVDHVDAGQSLGRALGFSPDTRGRFHPLVPGVTGGLPLPPAPAPDTFVPGKTVGDDTPNSPLVGPTKDQTRVAATPSQQGAAETPEPKPAPPTPAPEQATATGPPPEGNTSQQPPEPKEKGKQSGLDSLGAALAGVRALPPPTPQHIFSPQAPRPTNQISRSNAPQILMQELMSAARPGAALRLGQALQGK